MNTRSLKAQSRDNEKSLHGDTAPPWSQCVCVCTRVSLRRMCVHVCVFIKSELVLRKVGIELLQHIQEQGSQTGQFQTSLSVVDL